jgi:hypothetical protein
MKKMLDLRYGPHEQTAVTLTRLCFPIALSIETRQPATALKLLEAAYDTHRSLNDIIHPFREKAVPRKLQRALHSARCCRAILKRLLKEEPKEAARVTAAHEVVERLIEMLNS